MKGGNAMKQKVLSISVLLFLTALNAKAGVMVLPADQVLSSPPRWHNVENVYLDDALYAIDTCTSNKLDTFTVGLQDPIDTLGKRITKVVIYSKARTHYPKAMFWLWPVFGGTAYRSGNFKIGTTETTFSFDITPQDSTLPDTTWNWDDIAGLGILYQARTTKVIYYINYEFAAVTYEDTINVQAAHRFVFAPIATPETVGVPFPLNISVLDSNNELLTSYNGSALITDQTGTVSPVTVNFAGGVGAANVIISDTLSNDFIVIDDGTANDTSGLFDVVNSGLHHFAIDSIGAQIKNIPFTVKLSARDFFDDTVATFAGKADLRDRTGTLTPDSTGSFVSGTWSGSVNVGAGIAVDSVFCSLFNGRTISGSSNAFYVDDPLGIEGDRPELSNPVTARLGINPNPVRDQAEFSAVSPAAGPARIVIYNMLGQKAAEKDLGNVTPGTVKVNWELGSKLPQGLYFAGLEINGKRTAFRKLVILK
jgi:hypothetical protein